MKDESTSSRPDRRRLVASAFGAAGLFALAKCGGVSRAGNSIKTGTLTQGLDGLPVDACDTIADLKNTVVPPSSGSKFVNVGGFYVDGDGGGGPFVWVAPTTQSCPDGGSWNNPVRADDGGTVIQSTVSGAPSGYWQRQYSGALNVRWFGAYGDASCDDTAAIQAAVNAAAHMAVGTSPGLLTGTFLETAPAVYFPSGRYLISNTIVVGDYQSLVADYGATLFSANTETPLVRIGGYYNVIDGLTFGGGQNHIVLYGEGDGSPTSGSVVIITNCIFRYAAGPSIYIDPTVTTPQRGSTTRLTVDNFDFQGASLYWGCADWCEFRDGRVQIDETNPIFDGGGNPIACWNTNGSLLLTDVFADAAINSNRVTAAFIQGCGSFVCQGTGFGGDTGLVPIRMRAQSNDYTYLGNYLPLQSGTEPSLVIRNAGIASAGGGSPLENWLEIYDVFPALIDVTPMAGETPAGNDYEPIFGSAGVWVDQSSISLSALTARNNGSCIIRLRGNAAPFRFRMSTDPTNAASGTDLTPFLRQFMEVQSDDMTTSVLFGQVATPRNNLSLPGIVDVRHLYGGIASGCPWTTIDTSTGYSLQSLGATQDGAYYDVPLTTGATSGWGGGLPAGEYVFSMYIKASFSANVIFQVGPASQGFGSGLWAAVRPLVPAPRFQRLWFTFYHDGTAKMISFAIYGIPNGGSFTPGLFAIQAGTAPAPYLYPVDNASNPVGNATAEDRMVGTYYAPAAPTVGTYNLGDITYNTSPASGGYVGWVCTAGGSPGTWKGFGAISS